MNLYAANGRPPTHTVATCAEAAPAPRPPVRWVKVAWLASLLGRHMAQDVRKAARIALGAIDDNDSRKLAECLRAIAQEAGSLETRRLAADAALTVEREAGLSSPLPPIGATLTPADRGQR